MESFYLYFGMISKVATAIAPLQQELLTHPLYKRIQNPEDLRLFMEHHVFAVWDFMSLLKALQQGLTCTSAPWQPIGNPETRYLINEIVLAEETDIDLAGNRQSHYEMYLDAMRKAGADVGQIEQFVAEISSNADPLSYIANATLPDSIKSFLTFTFETIASGKLHCVAAAFTFGREDLIPEMFSAIIGNIQSNFPEAELTEFKYYFDRHIELDGDVHGPMALTMVADLCTSEADWSDVIRTSRKALKIRKKLWDGILDRLKTPMVHT